MDECKKDTLALIIVCQDRIALLEEQLRVTEAELKTKDSRISALEETVQQYRDSETSDKERVRFLELLNADNLSTITALEYACEELERKKQHTYYNTRPSLVTVEEDIHGKYPSAFKCLPCDVRKGDLLADYEDECVVREVVLTDVGYTIYYNGLGESTFAPNQLVSLHQLAPEGVPYNELASKNEIQDLKKRVKELEEQLQSVGSTENKVSVVTPKNAVKYPHYFREVTNTTHIDVNWILKAYNVPCCEGHAIKKLLVSGQRGAKNRMQDLKEARDSIDRAIELEKL